MKCPICGKEMTSGYLRSKSITYFTKIMHKMCSLPEEKDDIVLTDHNLLCPTADAYCCPDCKYVMIPYKDNIE